MLYFISSTKDDYLEIKFKVRNQLEDKIENKFINLIVIVEKSNAISKSSIHKLYFHYIYSNNWVIYLKGL